MNYHHVYFLKSAFAPEHFPDDSGREVAFIGRSNAGKSSALNALTGQKKLAKTSRTPGRTQCINFFVLNDERRLVDLPGYGYAKVPQKIKRQWISFVDHYLRERESLCGLIVLMDIRRPLEGFEDELLSWADDRKLPAQLLLTKADKLSRSVQLNSLRHIQKAISARFSENITASLFSSKEEIGRKVLQEKLDQWLGFQERE